jgi:hypothetical protein
MTTPFNLCNLIFPLPIPKNSASTRNCPLLSCHTRVRDGLGPDVEWILEVSSIGL